MVKRSCLDLRAGEQRDDAVGPIPALNCIRVFPRNNLGIIIVRDLDTDLCQIAVKPGILCGQCSRNQFDLCPQRLLTMEDVNLK